MTAGSVTLDELKSRSDDYSLLNRTASDFRVRVNAILEDIGVNAISTGYGSLTYIHWLHSDLGEPPLTGKKLSAASDHETMDRFQGLLMQEGVFGYHGLGAMSFSHSADDIASTLSAIEIAAKSLV
ncbi:MAG: hypothetical protein ACW992_10785, partial [Candidatus Thorarchaeota archaeon]|jgi:glutamate-1-semialdehyde aminotransferase